MSAPVLPGLTERARAWLRCQAAVYDPAAQGTLDEVIELLEACGLPLSAAVAEAEADLGGWTLGAWGLELGFCRIARGCLREGSVRWMQRIARERGLVPVGLSGCIELYVDDDGGVWESSPEGADGPVAISDGLRAYLECTALWDEARRSRARIVVEGDLGDLLAAAIGAREVPEASGSRATWWASEVGFVVEREEPPGGRYAWILGDDDDALFAAVTRIARAGPLPVRGAFPPALKQRLAEASAASVRLGSPRPRR